jgi:hypothetical protein
VAAERYYVAVAEYDLAMREYDLAAERYDIGRGDMMEFFRHISNRRNHITKLCDDITWRRNNITYWQIQNKSHKRTNKFFCTELMYIFAPDNNFSKQIKKI